MENPSFDRISVTMLRERSTFFGFASALVCALVAGSVAHWSLFWMAATAIAGIFFFPRCFYGFKEARALRDADFELGSGKSVSWYVEPPPNQLVAKGHAEMRGAEAGDESDDAERPRESSTQIPRCRREVGSVQDERARYKAHP